MEKKIIYQKGESISVIHPTGLLPIEATAKKSVPFGVKYKIIDASDLPKDRTFRGAWEFDFTKDSDGVGA